MSLQHSQSHESRIRIAGALHGNPLARSDFDGDDVSVLVARCEIMKAELMSELRSSSEICRTETPIAAGQGEIALTQAAFDVLLEYSASLPTGTQIGKRWKRCCPDRGEPHSWWMGEYVPDSDPTMVGITWRKIIIL